MRIGIIGTENTHTLHYLRMLNGERRHPAMAVHALWGADAGEAENLADIHGVPMVAQTPEELADEVDAVIVTDRHGGHHRRHALPALSLGKPVFVDKPLACDVEDATAILRAARDAGAPVMSVSALRYQPDTARLRADLARVGDARQVFATGPADPDNPNGGAFFYGVHTVELALALAGGAVVEELHIQVDHESALAIGRVHGVQLVIGLVRPDATGEVPFHAQVVGPRGMASRTIDVTDAYLAPVLDRFVAMVRTGEPPLGAEEMLTSVRITAAIDEAWSACR